MNNEQADYVKRIKSGLYSKDILAEGLEELASLRAENTLLWEIVRAVADSDCTYYDGFDDQQCIFVCGGEETFDGRPYQHTEACPSSKARALVEQAKRGKGE